MKILRPLFVSFFLLMTTGITAQDQSHLAAPRQSYYLPLQEAPIYGYTQPTQSTTDYSRVYTQPRTPSWEYYHQNSYTQYRPAITAVNPPLYHNPYYNAPYYNDTNYNYLPPPPPVDYAFPNSTQTNMLYWYLQGNRIITNN